MSNQREQGFDGARDRLYSVEPDEFIAERDRLAKLLRADGEPAAAADVQKLRRPSVAAWSINQAARADRHRVEELFAAGEALEHAHRDASSGRAGTDVRDAARRRRALVDALTERAVGFAASLTPNPATHRDAIEATWEAASIEPEVQPIVAAGWLPKELPRPSGFGLGASGPSTSKRATAVTAATPTRSAPPRDELALRRAQAALADARQELEEAEDEAARADRDASAAQEAHDDAARRVADLEAATTAARAEAREAARAAKAAEQSVARAQAARDRARRKVDKSARAVTDREG